MTVKNKPTTPALSRTARGIVRSGSRVSFARVAALSKPTKLNTAKASDDMTEPSLTLSENCTGSTTVPWRPTRTAISISRNGIQAAAVIF